MRFNSIAIASLAFAMFVAAFFVVPSTATAGSHSNSCMSQKGYYWKTITVYVERCVPYQVRVKYVKPCGAVYYKWVTKYKTVIVPVKKRIKVWY